MELMSSRPQHQSLLHSIKLAKSRNTNKLPRQQRYCCSAIAVDAPSPLAGGGVSGVRWGSSTLQGPRSEMEDDIVLRSDGLAGFSFAAVFDGHAGFSSVEFLRDELYNECVTALQGGLLLTSKNFNAIKEGISKAFEIVDTKLLNWLEQMGKDVDSGATATVVFLGKDVLIISHVGDSSVVISRSGKAEILTSPHRPYGNNRVSLEEVKRIRAAGGWIVDGRICGDISVSRAFGDMRFKTRKNEMLVKGVEEGRWTEKFISSADEERVLSSLPLKEVSRELEDTTFDLPSNNDRLDNGTSTHEAGKAGFQIETQEAEREAFHSSNLEDSTDTLGGDNDPIVGNLSSHSIKEDGARLNAVDIGNSTIEDKLNDALSDISNKLSMISVLQDQEGEGEGDGKGCASSLNKREQSLVQVDRREDPADTCQVLSLPMHTGSQASVLHNPGIHSPLHDVSPPSTGNMAGKGHLSIENLEWNLLMNGLKSEHSKKGLKQVIPRRSTCLSKSSQ